MALASTRTSAHVIPFPGAAAAPVANPKRRLRYSTADRNVTHIEKLRVDRAWRLQQETAAPQAQPQRRPFNAVRDRFCATFAIACNALTNDALKEATECMLRNMSVGQRLEVEGICATPAGLALHD